MSRHVKDREDLMREATALVRRVELQWSGPPHDGAPATCVVGFRRGGEASVFVGTDPVFQFNAAGELRRGFWNGRLVKAERGSLVQLERRPAGVEIQLIRHELTDGQTIEFVQLATETLNRLQRLLRGGELVVLKRVPSDMDVARDLAGWLDSVPQPLKIASAPNVKP